MQLCSLCLFIFLVSIYLFLFSFLSKSLSSFPQRLHLTLSARQRHRQVPDCFASLFSCSLWALFKSCGCVYFLNRWPDLHLHREVPTVSSFSALERTVLFTWASHMCLTRKGKHPAFLRLRCYSREEEARCCFQLAGARKRLVDEVLGHSMW